MSAHTTDPLVVAEAMMKERRDTVKSLAKLGDEKATLQAKIAEIQKQEADAYGLALAAGWSQSELKKMGLTRKTTPGRAKRLKDDPATITPINSEEVSAWATPQQQLRPAPFGAGLRARQITSATRSACRDDAPSKPHPVSLRPVHRRNRAPSLHQSLALKTCSHIEPHGYPRGTARGLFSGGEEAHSAPTVREG